MSTEFTYEWSCPMCTLLNNSSVNNCSLCGAQRDQTDANTEVLNSQVNLITSLKPQQQPSPQLQQSSTYIDDQTNNMSKEYPMENQFENNKYNNPNENKDDVDYEFEDDDDEFENDEFDNDTGNSGQNNEEKVEYEFEDDFEEDDDANCDGGWGDDTANCDGWGDDTELCYDEQKVIDIKDEESSEHMLKRAMEKRRLAQSKLESFWKCGKCEFLNHPSRAVCMMCSMPQLDVVHHIMTCPKNELKVCPRCQAFVVPYLYDDHVLDCKPMGVLDNAKSNQAWFCKLTPCEQKAINHVNGNAIKKSEDNLHKRKLTETIAKIDGGKYASEIPETIKAMHHFLEWKVPIIIRIHIDGLIAKLLNDTHYRNLFEIGKGSGSCDKNVRKQHEKEMFGPVYDKAKPFERPKYGCLNVGLTEQGCQKATTYGDGYLLMNDTTVRWRTTLTHLDSFSVAGNCGTLKHCNHLLTQLQPAELQEIIEVSLYGETKTGGSKQTSYREIQIHGPIQLNRDVISVHVPAHHKNNKKLAQKLETFCQINMCKLVYFEPYKQKY